MFDVSLGNAGIVCQHVYNPWKTSRCQNLRQGEPGRSSVANCHIEPTNLVLESPQGLTHRNEGDMQSRDQTIARQDIEKMCDYFKPAEFACPCCGLYLMDDRLLGAIDHLRAAYGKPLILESAYRCPKHNKEIPGSAPDSKHMSGEAVDLKISRLNSFELGFLLQIIFSDYRSLGVSKFSGFGMGKNRLHIDVRRGDPAAWGY